MELTTELRHQKSTRSTLLRQSRLFIRVDIDLTAEGGDFRINPVGGKSLA